MDIEKLIEQLNRYFEGETLPRGTALDAATALSTLQAEKEKLMVRNTKLEDTIRSQRNGLQELRAELEQVKRERDAAVKDIELIVRRINDCNIKLDDGTTVSSLELGRCHVCKHEETGDCDDGGCIFEWRGQKED